MDISGEGKFHLTTADKQARFLLVYSTVIGYPNNHYADLKRPRDKSLFGYALLMAGDYVLKEVPIEYDGQVLYLYENREASVQQQMLCHTYGMLWTMRDLGQTFGATWDFTPPWPAPTTESPVDYIWFKLFHGVVLRVGRRADPVTKCDDAPSIPWRKTDLPSQNDLGDKLGDKSPKPSDGSGIAGSEGILPPGDNSNPIESEGGGIPEATGRWKMHFTMQNGESTTQDLNDTNPQTVWSLGGNCNSGGFNNGCGTGGPYGQWCGKTVVRNGTPVNCVEDGQKGSTVSLRFEYVETQ